MKHKSRKQKKSPIFMSTISPCGQETNGDYLVERSLFAGRVRIGLFSLRG